MNDTQRRQLDDAVQVRRAADYSPEHIRRAVIAQARRLAPPDIARRDVEAFLDDHGLLDE
jgi:hypothetical protein